MSTIKIKITAQGGYVVGDGKCPFDPDEFLILFGEHMIEAKREGLAELEFSEAEIDNLMQAQKNKFAASIIGAPVHEITIKRGATVDPRRLLDALPTD